MILRLLAFPEHFYYYRLAKRGFPDFLKSCSIVIIEKSPVLTKIQKKKLHDNKIIWLTEFTKLKKKPCIFVANEFFDSMAIKQFLKIKNSWFERFVSFKSK